MDAIKKRLSRLINDKAMTYGEFQLASGVKSNYYVDMSKVLLDAEGLYLASLLVIDAVPNWKEVEAIGGPATGAIPLVSSILTLFHESNVPMRGFFVRKESKTHGKKDLVEGYLGQRVVLVEDVTTSGQSLLKAVEEVQDQDCTVMHVVSILDRGTGAKDLFPDIPFTSILTIGDIFRDQTS